MNGFRLIAAAMLAAAVACLVLAGVLAGDALDFYQTAVTATGVTVEKLSRETGGRQPGQSAELTIRYRAVNGGDYEIPAVQTGRNLAAGQKVTIFYAPSDPHTAVTDKAAIWIVPVIIGLTGLLLGLLAAAFFFMAIRTAPQKSRPAGRRR